MADYREKCLSEKGEECFICGSDGVEIAVHHVDGDRGNNDLENLIPLCYPCHLSIHNGAKGYEEWQNEVQDLQERDHSKTHIQVSGEVHELLKEHKRQHDVRSLNDALHDILRNAGYDIPEPVPAPDWPADLNEVLLAEFEDAFPEPLTAVGLSEQFGCSSSTINDHLWELNGQGKLASKKVGARARIWWKPETEYPTHPLVEHEG